MKRSIYTQFMKRHRENSARMKNVVAVRVERQLAWCPREYRDQYRALKKKGVRAAEAREAIEALIVRDAQKHPATFR